MSKSVAAKLYFKNSTLQEDHAGELLQMLSVPFKGRVLDLGCGTGFFATVLSELVGPDGVVIAVDPDPERIALAKKLNSRLNIQYFVADDKSFPGENYELIVCLHVIHWIKNKSSLLEHLSSKLAENGTFGFITYNGTPEHPQIFQKAFTLISPTFERELIYNRMEFEKDDYYVKISSDLGLEVIGLKIVHKELRHSSLQEFLVYWSAVSHGEFTMADIDTNELQHFKNFHEKEFIDSVIHLPVLCVLMKKIARP